MSDATSASSSISRKRAVVVGGLLAALTVFAYARVAGNGFTTFDDPVYVTQNPRVTEGLTTRGIAWALTSVHGSNWHPLTWISHMIDCGLFGLRATGHHLVGLAFHVATTLLLLRLLVRTTAALLPSAFVAAVFALHPLHVESVAWASERKDVLCAFFWVLALLAYVRWAERPGIARYAVVLLWFVLGLLSKPMIVTLPITMLLLDAWPLRRIERSTFRSLVLEKTPFFALSVTSSVATYAIQRSTGAMELGASTPFAARLGNAIVAYVAYLGKAFWPANLQAYYPFPQTPYSVGLVAAVATLLALVTVVALLSARTRPWIAVGWLWYLATLLPVIGLVQVGGQAMADRYTYVPLIGVSIAVAWSFAELARRVPLARPGIAGASLACVAAWTALTWKQVGYWKDDASLYVIARAKIKDDALLGRMLLEQDRPSEAIDLLRRALEYEPERAEIHHELGRALEAVGRQVDAEEEFRVAVRKKPDFAEAHFDLAIALLARGRTDEGVAELQTTLALAPGDVRAQRALRRVTQAPVERKDRGEKSP